MPDYQVTLTARNFTDSEECSWVPGHVVEDPGFMTTAVTPGQCPPGNTIFMVYGLDGRQVPMENPQASGWVVFPSNSMWICLDVMKRKTAYGEYLAFVALMQVPRSEGKPQFFMPSREAWKSYCHDFHHRVTSVSWDGRGLDVMPVPQTLLSLTDRRGAIHPYDVKKREVWATAGPDFVLGSAEGFMRRALGALAVLHDKSFSQESRRAVESVVRSGIASVASEFDGGDASGEVVTLRESLLVGNTQGFTGQWDAVSPPWRRALETFPRWADDKSKADGVDWTQVAVLQGSRHGLSPNRLKEKWVAAERDWVTRTIGKALGFTDASWVENDSDLGENVATWAEGENPSWCVRGEFSKTQSVRYADIVGQVRYFVDGFIAEFNGEMIEWPRSAEAEFNHYMESFRTGQDEDDKGHSLQFLREVPQLETFTGQWQWWLTAVKRTTMPLIQPFMLPSEQVASEDPQTLLMVLTCKTRSLQRKSAHHPSIYAARDLTDYNGLSRRGFLEHSRIYQPYLDPVTMPHKRFDRLFGYCLAVHSAHDSDKAVSSLSVHSDTLLHAAAERVRSDLIVRYVKQHPVMCGAASVFLAGPVLWHLNFGRPILGYDPSVHEVTELDLARFVCSTELMAALHGLDPLMGVRHALPALGEVDGPRVARMLDYCLGLTPPSGNTAESVQVSEEFAKLGVWLSQIRQLARLSVADAFDAAVDYERREEPFAVELFAWLGAWAGAEKLVEAEGTDRLGDLKSARHHTTEFGMLSHRLQVSENAPTVRYQKVPPWYRHRR